MKVLAALLTYCFQVGDKLTIHGLAVPLDVSVVRVYKDKARRGFAVVRGGGHQLTIKPIPLTVSRGRDAADDLFAFMVEENGALVALNVLPKGREWLNASRVLTVIQRAHQLTP